MNERPRPNEAEAGKQSPLDNTPQADREDVAGSRETPSASDDRKDEELRARNGDSAKMSTADLAYGRSDSTKDDQPGVKQTSAEVSLIRDEDAGGFRDRWTSIQTKFIDAPRETVGDADELVAEVIQSLASRFAEERQTLEQQWQSGTEVSTEDLRLAMQHYRAFFERLLAA